MLEYIRPFLFLFSLSLISIGVNGQADDSGPPDTTDGYVDSVTTESDPVEVEYAHEEE